MQCIEMLYVMFGVKLKCNEQQKPSPSTNISKMKYAQGAVFYNSGNKRNTLLW
jgi:hypothetical protein